MSLFKILFSFLITVMLAISNVAYATVYDFGNLGDSFTGSLRFDFIPDQPGQSKTNFTNSNHLDTATIYSTNGLGLSGLSDADFGAQFEQGNRIMLADISAPVTLPVPEPETYVMILAGLALIGLAARHRR